MKYYRAKMPEAYARIEWCKKVFGDIDYTGYVPGRRWYRKRGHLYFRNEQDYMFYRLRWP